MTECPARVGTSGQRPGASASPVGGTGLPGGPVEPTLPTLTVLPWLSPLHAHSCRFPHTSVPVRCVGLLLLDP